MTIADHPLHRSGRATLPHPAPTLGDNAQAHEGIRVADSGAREPGSDERRHSGPRQMIALTTPTQYPPPGEANRAAEGTDRGSIHRDAVVTHVTENDRTQLLANLGDGVVHATLEFEFHFPQLRLPPLSHRLVQHRKATLASLPATVREAREIEAIRCAPITAFLSLASRIAANLDQSCLLGVQFQPEVREPPAQLDKEPLSLDLMLEPNDQIISKTYHDDLCWRRTCTDRGHR